MSLNALAEALTDTGLVKDVEVDEGFVHGDALVASIGLEVSLNVDPDPEDAGHAVDVDLLVANSVAVLAMTRDQYEGIAELLIEELTEALAEEGIEQVKDLASDVALVSLVAFPDGHGLVFVSPEQFPDGNITVLVDQDWTVHEILLSGAEGGCEDCDCGSDHGDAEFIAVESLTDELRTH